MVHEDVIGIKLNPITPAIYSLLLGTNNAFFTGKIPSEGDLRNFIWFCSPQFNPDMPIASYHWRWVQMWRLRRAMRAGATIRTLRKTVINNFFRACRQIHEIIAVTFSDGAPQGEGGEPIAASMEAQVLDLFARQYLMWPLPKPVRHTPIKQLLQLARCIDRRECGENAKYFDRDENRLTLSFLQEANTRN